ncbi:Uncharacterised protein [Mycobacteroides abscessus subsp. abscessus]|nr:Uncharacterised protein [Mycobacteroides abscessus subsp. abscessus]
MFRRRKRSRELLVLNELADQVCDDFDPTYPMLWEDAAANLDERQTEVSGGVEEVLEAFESLTYDSDLPTHMLIGAIREDIDGLAAVVTSAEPAEQTLVARMYALLDFADRVTSGTTVSVLLDSAAGRREPEPAGRDDSSSLGSDRSDDEDAGRDASERTSSGVLPSIDDDRLVDGKGSSGSGDVGRSLIRGGAQSEDPEFDGLRAEQAPTLRGPRSWVHIVFGMGLGWVLALTVFNSAMTVLALKDGFAGEGDMAEVFAFLAIMSLLVLVNLVIVVLWYRSRLRR